MPSLTSPVHDCLVSLYRAKGFGFDIAESMGKGKIVIATNFSGALISPAPRVACLCPMTEVGKPAYIHGTGQWLGEARSRRGCRRDPTGHWNVSDVQRLGGRARADTMRQYSYAVGKIVKAAWQDQLEVIKA